MFITLRWFFGWLFCGILLVRKPFGWPVIGWITLRYDFCLPEAWVKFSSQHIIMTDEQCKNTMITALSMEGVDTDSWLDSAELFTFWLRITHV